MAKTFESDGHPIIGHYVIGALEHKEELVPLPRTLTVVSCACLRNDDYRTPAYRFSPCARSLAGSRPRTAHFANAPLGAGALFRNAARTHIGYFLGKGAKKKEIGPNACRAISVLGPTLQIVFAAAC